MPVPNPSIENTAGKALVLIHLSDIHFSKPATGNLAYSPDDDIRHELQRDAGILLERERLGRAHFVLVTGDIAFAGGREEYDRADAWLKELCAQVNCPEQFVRTIPGNHDVQRLVVDESQSLQDAHALLRKTDTAQVDQMLGRYFADKGAPNLLFRSIQHYNDFAAKFGCGFDSQRPFWQHEVLLNDGSVLRIRGLNSAVVSDKLDDRGANKLVVGSNVCVLKNEEGVEYLVMCHHPPSWLRDDEELQARLDSRARVMLFGHKHVQRIFRQTTAAGHETLRLHAGAVNPEVGALEYQPRYNVLALSVTQQGGQRMLQVAVHRRAWDAAEQAFADVSDAGGGTCQTFYLKLPAWTPPVALADAVSIPSVVTQEPLQTLSDPLSIMPDDFNRIRMNAARRLAYRFLALPYHKRMQVVQHLGLLCDEDQNVTDPELSRRFFQRAKEREQMAEMWRQVEDKYGTESAEKNPFQST